MEYIVLQPLQATVPDKNISLIQRKSNLTQDEEGLIEHKAGGPFSGFVVKKILPLHMQRTLSLDKCHLSFKLNVFMKRAGNESEDMQHELRILQFWFSTDDTKERMTCSNSFFHNLFKGDNFPKDYFMFLLKIMQIFKALRSISQLKIEFEKVGLPQPINTPMSIKDPKQYAAIISAKILEFLERAFPNTISVDELSRLTECNSQLVYEFLSDLYSRNLVNFYDNGSNWIRNIINHQDEQTHEVIMIQQQPKVSNNDQPTVAIITVNYYEKLAVDAMMTNKVTFVRHKPEGESNVYTIGNIGSHRCVSTKLPSFFSRDSRSAKISSGNTTTRLLGIFQRIDHVILVGCAGGVPHYSDYTRHPRRGDIIVSYPEGDDSEQPFVYAHFDVQKSSQNTSQIVRKSWMPASNDLYKIVNNIRKQYNAKAVKKYKWEEYLEEGISSLFNEELDCKRPNEDKLFFTVSDNNKSVIEVNHPEDLTNSSDRRQFNLPTVRFGKIGGGELVVKDENIRHSIAEQFGIMCFDSDIDQVMESIEGNRKESFILIRSIVDYQDGTTSKEWQPYASICAAAFMRTLIMELPVSTEHNF